VILVGWDDKFPSYNFGGYDKPLMNGAWLVRNSWGLDDYGKNGYFWISYEDASLLGGGSVKAYSVDTNVFDNVYSYVAGEQTTTLAGTGNTISFSVDYQVDAGEAIKAVAVQTLNANARIDVTVTADGQSATGTSSNKTAGTYTIPLSRAITTSAPTTATVTVKITAATGDRAKIVLEPFNAEGVTPTIGTQRNVVMGGITHTVTLDKGFKAGSSQRYDGDPKIRLYTDNTESAPVNTDGKLEITNGQIYDYANSTHQLELSGDSVVVDPAMVNWSVIDEDVATVSADGVVTVGSKRGTTIVTGTYTDGSVSYKASINVTVRPYAISYNLAADEKCRRQYLEYYPGDDANCKLPVAEDMSKDGYELNGWKDASGATVTVDTLKTGAGDLVLTPKWNRYEIAVRYYKPNEDGQSYTTTKKFIDSFMITAAPFVLPSPEAMDDSPLNYVADGKQFSYWSKDAEGKEMVTSIGAEAFKATQNPYLGTYSIDKDIVLYPQFDKPVPKPTQPVTGGGESNDDGGHGNYVAPAVVDVPEAGVTVQNRIVTAKTTANLRMRVGAGKGYRIITTVRRGDLVQILGTAVNGWYPCKYGEFVGFMSARYLADLMIVGVKPLDDAKPEEKTYEYYVVKKGDTLGKIARKYGTSVGEIVRMNKGVHPRITEDYIVTGWKIRVR
jgi:LysM repeat protein